MKRLWKTIITAALLSCAALSFADTLINRKTGRTVGVGTATIENQIIHWTACHQSTATTNYTLQEYKVIQGDNCDIQQLPKTGSSLPLIAALGLAFFAVGLVMYVRSRALCHDKTTN
jgi:LPXTG-motif cell wall-anchored protein